MCALSKRQDMIRCWGDQSRFGDPEKRLFMAAEVDDLHPRRPDARGAQRVFSVWPSNGPDAGVTRVCL